MKPFPQAQDRGPDLVALLSRPGGAAAPSTPRPLSGRLSEWIDWRHAVALAAALEPRREPAALSTSPAIGEPGSDGDPRAAFEALRATLLRSIESEPLLQPGAPTVAPDTSRLRQRYIALQQIMDAEVRHLRGRLRGRLGRRSSVDARLAAVDAVMEQALAARERSLLTPVPDVLIGRYEQAVAAAGEAPAGTPAAQSAPAASPPVEGPHFQQLQRDLGHALRAELDLRMQPLHGLLAALGTPRPESHAR